MTFTGIIPAAGKADRMYGLPKMFLPIPGGSVMGKVVERLQQGGASQILVGASPVNQSTIETYAPQGVTVYRAQSLTMVETVLTARRWCGEKTIMAMADSYWYDTTLVRRMRDALDEVDLVIGAFVIRPGQHRKLGMIHRVNGHIEIIDKPIASKDSTAWGLVGWKEPFWEFMNAKDKHLGLAMNAAVNAGLKWKVEAGAWGYFDLGTLDEYYELLTAMTDTVMA